ncbi:MAG: TetR/AcrR family transcriptional regulator [Halanaerobiaceae bacterium]
MERDKHDTRKLILESARKEFAKEGYYATSMAAIADEAGLGKGTLYWHFSSKEELFKELIKTKGEKLVRDIHKIKSKDLELEQFFREYIRFELEKTDRIKDDALIFLNSENFINQDFMDELLNIRANIISELKEVIEKGLEEGLLQGDSAEIMAVSIMGVINAVGISLLVDEKYDAGMLEDLTYDFIFNGIEK